MLPKGSSKPGRRDKGLKEESHTVATVARKGDTVAEVDLIHRAESPKLECLI